MASWSRHSAQQQAINGVSFSPDGRLLTSRSPLLEEVRIFDASTLDERARLVAGEGIDRRRGRFQPDGEQGIAIGYGPPRI